MSLDLGETILQLDRVVQRLDLARDNRQLRLQGLLEAAAQVSAPSAIEKTRFAADRPFLAAQVVDSLISSYAPTPPPEDWCVVSVDGSHIDVDRHIPLSCYLINLGGCALTYGANPDARLFSRPELAFEDHDLYLTDTANPANQETVQGPLLGLLRTVKELRRLAAAVREIPSTPLYQGGTDVSPNRSKGEASAPPLSQGGARGDLPVLALMDGSLVLWGLSGRGYPPFVRDAIIRDRLLPVLDELRDLARHQPITVAAYVSLPRSTEVVNAIRCCLCPHDLSRCQESCSNRRSTHQPCDAADSILDREIFQARLPKGWRSSVYLTNSSVSREHYGEHQVHFYYLNVGTEIARVEVPQWIAQDERLLALSHSLILDQCHRGQGYPVAISEAHEQAVINGADRRVFKRMVAEALERQGLPVYTSEKERSKRTPWL